MLKLFGIPYEVRNTSGDWSPYFGSYEGQRFGPYDTDCCWDFAGCEELETQLEYLWQTGQFTDDDKAWFRSNGYIDSEGDFYLSRRWTAILSGAKDNGNDQDNFWDIVSKAGMVPNALLPYNPIEAKPFLNKDDFNNAYFDPTVITKELELLGEEFLKRVKIQHEEVGNRWQPKASAYLIQELKQSSLQIGIPVPQDGTWNQVKINYNGRVAADHSVELYRYDEVADYNYPYFIYDSYEPHLKQLSRSYYLPVVTKPVVTSIGPQATPVPVLGLWQRIGLAIRDYFDSYLL